jgi:hypothetical protein
MRAILRVAFSMGMVLFVLLGRALAQQPMGSMMSESMPMMGWPMMLFMGLFWVLLLILMVLAILWLVKQLRK